tara:strand:+ start:6787 stop:7164 length:378 start_codon:yes stop_codon:yes gene_type:complete
MTHIYRSIVAILCLLNTAPAFANDQMSAADVAKIVAGSTLEGATASGIGYTAIFARNGGISVSTDSYGDDTGRWWVTKNDYLCMQYENFYNGVERCVWFRATGKFPGFKAFIQDTDEPTYFELKK